MTAARLQNPRRAPASRMRTRGVTTAQEGATGKPGLKFLTRAAEDERRVTDLVSLPMVRYVPALVRECAPDFQGGPMELPDTAAQACGTCRNRLKRGGVKLIVAHDGDTVRLANGCLCCSALDGPGKALAGFLRRADRLDRIVIGISGMADPARLMQNVAAVRLPVDGVIVLVDARQLPWPLASRYVARVQPFVPATRQGDRFAPSWVLSDPRKPEPLR